MGCRFSVQISPSFPEYAIDGHGDQNVDDFSFEINRLDRKRNALLGIFHIIGR